MTTFEMQQKERNMEAFNSVVALYSVLKPNIMSLRVKQAIYRADEVAAEPVDFLIDVELKTKRLVGQRFYDIFLRAVLNENLEILSETLREALGRTFVEYGLGPDGAYARLYYRIKNDQIRSYMREQNGNFRADGTEPNQFD
jgi:hypothetical protein